MAKQESLSSKIEEWMGEGLISPDQAEPITAYEALAERRRVSPREIFLYIGGFFVLMAVVFGLQLLWDDLSSLGRVVAVVVPTLILWAAGEALRRREEPLLRRGAHALWMLAAWLTAILIVVILIEWPGLELKGEWLLLWASLSALPLAVIALLLLPGLPQGLAAVTLASGLAIGVTLVVDATWPEIRWAAYLAWLVVGAVGLAAAEVARRREKGSLIWLFNLFGACSWLVGALVIALMADKADIYVMDADGSNETRLTRGASGAWSPAWSPDGSRIAFESDGDVYVMDADGSNQTGLTGYEASSPAWSPDGRRIAFEAWDDGNTDIYLRDVDGSNPTRLTRNEAFDWSPAWSPDGRRIAFESSRDGDLEIYVMDVDGSNQTRLTRDLANDMEPAWSPDGSRIAFQSERGRRPSLLAWDVLLLIESLIFIAWSVPRESRALLCSGLLSLLVGILLINALYFRDQLGLPVVLLITGVALIAIGLGADRLRWREARL